MGHFLPITLLFTAATGRQSLSFFVILLCTIEVPPEAQSSHFAHRSQAQLLHEHLGSQPLVPG